MTYEISATGLTRIIHEEVPTDANGDILAKYLSPYPDPIGIATIACGHKVRRGERFGTLTQAEAHALLLADVAPCLASLDRNVKRGTPLNQNQVDALCSFLFNVGSAALDTSALRPALCDMRDSAVPALLKAWCKGVVGGKLVVLPFLLARREREAALFSTPMPHDLSESDVAHLEAMHAEWVAHVADEAVGA